MWFFFIKKYKWEVSCSRSSTYTSTSHTTQPIIPPKGNVVINCKEHNGNNQYALQEFSFKLAILLIYVRTLEHMIRCSKKVIEVGPITNGELLNCLSLLHLGFGF